MYIMHGGDSMNYFKQLKAFDDWLNRNQCSASAQLLWYKLMSINNTCGWVEWFSRTNSSLAGSMNVSENTLKSARNELKQKGLIDFKTGTKKTAATKYKIIKLYTDKGFGSLTNDEQEQSSLEAKQVGSTNDEHSSLVAEPNGTTNDEHSSLVPMVSKIDTQTDTQYGMVSNIDTQTDTQTDTQVDTQTDTQVDGLNNYIHKTKTKTNKNKTPLNPPKVKFAEFVSLTNDEYSSLVARLGSEEAVKRCIEILDNYKGAKGVKYKSDYRAMLSWVIDRYEEEQARKARPLAPRSKTEQSLEELERLAIEYDRRNGQKAHGNVYGQLPAATEY